MVVEGDDYVNMHDTDVEVKAPVKPPMSSNVIYKFAQEREKAARTTKSSGRREMSHSITRTQENNLVD